MPKEIQSRRIRSETFRDVKPVSEPTLEAIAVEKRHEKLQIFLFPVLWSGGHQ
jgi:hypothetical protein